MANGHPIDRIVLLTSMALSLSSAFAGEDTEWLAVAERIPRTNLREDYHPVCRRTCEYIGFSFGGPLDELLEIRAAGANAVGMGGMWNPIRDEKAPYGVDVRSYGGYGSLEQSFRAENSFNGFAPCLPTGHSTDSGCRWNLFREVNEKVLPEPIASGEWSNVKDNSWPEARFPLQESGTYRFRISDATGTWIGWWGRYGNPYPDGHAFVGSGPKQSVDFEFRLSSGDRWETVVPGESGHVAFPLGPSPLKVVGDLGLFTNFSVGNWNNPGFPYYPDWFWERFPEAAAVDQNGHVITGGMFGRSVPAPGIEHPAIVNGTERFIKTVVGELLHDTPLIYWVMGGEAMYATYGYHGRWTDYGENAIHHFRQWLGHRRYQNIDELNAAWEAHFATFDDVEPPTEPTVSRPWLDWLDFRFESMGERFGWHCRAIRSVDPDRPILTCNHGSLYHDLTYAEMGARPEIYASMSDGFETGQIMTDTDPDLYNLMYAESLCGLGKPYAPVRLAYKKSDPRARGGGTSYTPEAARRYVYESLGSGAWHLGLIQWSGSLPDGEWGVRGTPAEKEIAKLFAEIRTLWPLLDDMHALRPSVGVFPSHPTWALEGFKIQWRDFHGAAVRNHVPKIYVYDSQLLSGDVYDLPYLISIENRLLGPGIPEALLHYVKGGGSLLVCGGFGNGTKQLTAELPVEFRSEKSGEIGDGRITFLKATDASSVLSALFEVADATEIRPVQIRTDTSVSRPVEALIAVEHTDWPQDLTSAKTLGQTVRLGKTGLKRVSIRMPTYLKVPPAGFTFELRENDPDGPLIAKREVPPGIADNAWVEIEVPAEVPIGTVLYLGATADPSLPASHLGWWSTRKDVYSGGTAYIDGQPVSGDRHVKLFFDEPVPAKEAIESFVLTDGFNFGVVLVNAASESVTAWVDLSSLPCPVASSGYAVRSPLDPSRYTADGLSGPVSIDGNGSLFLWVEYQAKREEAEPALAAARNRMGIWESQDAVTDFVRYALRKAEEYMEEKRYSKSLAMALKVCASLGLGLDIKAPNSLNCAVRVLDGKGNQINADSVLAEFIPTPASFSHLAPEGPGLYQLHLSADDLPPVYDYTTGRYQPYRGPLQVRISVRRGNLRNSRTLSLRVGER